MRIKTNIFFIVASICATSSFASPSDWEQVDDVPGGKIYIHSSSIYNGPQGKGGDRKKVRTLINYDVEQKNVFGEKFYSMEFFDELSCARHVRITTGSVQYQGKLGTGKVIRSHKMGVLIPQLIPPGTFEQMVLAEANCNLVTGIWGNAQ
jgi:hypothetical protein